MKNIRYGSQEPISQSMLLKLRGVDNNSLISKVISGDVSGFESDINKGLNINIKDPLGRNLLMIATLKGHANMIDKILFYKSIDINDTDNAYDNALIIAVRKGNLDIVNKLIDAGINSSYQNRLNPDMHNALMEASIRGFLEIVKVLSNKNDANAVDDNGNNALMLAAKLGFSEIVDYLSAFTTDLNKTNDYGYNALMLGAFTNSVAVVETLIAHGAAIDIKSNNGQDALMIASLRNNFDIVDLLASQAASDKFSALMIACYKGHIETCEKLLKDTCDINKANHKGTTPLMVAALHGYEKIVNLLIDRGADINAVNMNNETALMQIVNNNIYPYSFGMGQVIELLRNPHEANAGEEMLEIVGDAYFFSSTAVNDSMF